MVPLQVPVKPPPQWLQVNEAVLRRTYQAASAPSVALLLTLSSVGDGSADCGTSVSVALPSPMRVDADRRKRGAWACTHATRAAAIRTAIVCIFNDGPSNRGNKSD